jgi:hypothetical protein
MNVVFSHAINFEGHIEQVGCAPPNKQQQQRANFHSGIHLGLVQGGHAVGAGREHHDAALDLGAEFMAHLALHQLRKGERPRVDEEALNEVALDLRLLVG